MAAETMEMVSIRLKPEQIEQIDQVVATLGGNRSDFVRLAVDDRLRRMRVLAEWSEAKDLDDHEPVGVIPA